MGSPSVGVFFNDSYFLPIPWQMQVFYMLFIVFYLFSASWSLQVACNLFYLTLKTKKPAQGYLDRA